MQQSAMFRLMATLAGDNTHSGSAQDGWLVYLDSVCSNCGTTRAAANGWDEMWNTCAPCGRRLDCGSENSRLPEECKTCLCGECCTCPEGPHVLVEDCVDCPKHGDDAQYELHLRQQDEIRAETNIPQDQVW